MMIARLIALVAALALAAPAHAQSPSGTIEPFDTTFRGWMKENGVAKGILAVAYKERLVFDRGYGGQDPNERVLLASLSKAITGRCVAELVADGKLGFDSKVGDVLAPFFAQHGEPADLRIKDATVGQLLVHRAGFPPAPRDLMTSAAVELLQKTRSPATATPAELLAATLTAPLASAPGETFRYSNIGYLVLGVMIETVTSESYGRYCGHAVLERVGIRAPALDTEWSVFSAFGGWRLSSSEYTALLTRWEDLFRQGSADGERSRPIADVVAWLRQDIKRSATNGLSYALGQFERVEQRVSGVVDARRRFHAGSWGVAPDTIGMLAMQHESGASWFVWYTPRPGKDATDALMERLAALPVTIASWPAHDLFPARGLGSPAGK